jgi:hypothetical protein
MLYIFFGCKHLLILNRRVLSSHRYQRRCRHLLDRLLSSAYLLYETSFRANDGLREAL